MTYQDWFDGRVYVGEEAAQRNFAEIFGAEDSDYTGMIEFTVGVIFISEEHVYHVICGRDDLVTTSLHDASRFLWDNHSKDEIAAH